MVMGAQRPLEMTRHEWYTEDNLKTYYDVAVGVLLTAGVAERNPAYEPTEPFSEEILITRPDRIVSFDETRVELDCTSGGKGKTDRCLRESIHDDGETIVTKSNSTATAMCGRTGDGKALPVMVVFASGDSFHFQWAPVITSTYFKDRDGNPLEWRYRSNKKGSLNEEGYVDFLRSIVHPAVGYPPTRDSQPGHQGVCVCDGVGTHCGIFALEAALSLGLEVLLRVPHLSFKLQGEDTVNFKQFKVTTVFCCDIAA